MSNKRNDLYCSHTIDTLRHENHQFQWSHAYKWYFTLPLAEKELNKIWSSGIGLNGCVLEVAYFKEMLLWCDNKFDKNRIIIQVQGKLLISLSPSMLIRRIL
jgi:hypothetical protein